MRNVLQNIVCFGDSITEALPQSLPGRDAAMPHLPWPAVLQQLLDQRWPGTFAVYNRGLGGNTSAQGFDRLEADIIPLLPAIVVVQFGFNDANVRDWASVPRVGVSEFAKNLREFHRLTEARDGRCVFIVNHRISPGNGYQGNGRPYEENMAPYNDAIRRLARELRAVAIDLPALMSDVPLQRFLCADGLHLSGYGNRRYAQLVLRGLRDVLETDMHE